VRGGRGGINQRGVDGARVLHGVEHRLLGDGVEDNPLDRLLVERLLLLEHFQHMPGMASPRGRVGRQDKLAGALQARAMS